MNQKPFKKEIGIGKVEGEIEEKRGLDWMIISLALLIFTLIIGVLTLGLLSNNFFY